MFLFIRWKRCALCQVFINKLFEVEWVKNLHSIFFLMRAGRSTGMNLSISRTYWNFNLWMLDGVRTGTHTSYLLMIWYSKHFIKIDHKAKIQREKTLCKSIGWSDPYYQSVNRTHSLITVAIIYVYALATAKWHIVDVNFRFKGGTNVHNKRFAHSIAMVCSFSFSFLFEMCNW